MQFIRNKKHSLLVVGIFVVGLLLYLYKLDSIPSGFYIDEALPGYNAYSLLLTGRDEYGKLLPIVLRFYGSYNPPLFTYLTVITIALFGINVFSVRFVSAIAGVLSAIPFLLLLRSSGILKNKLTLVTSVLLFIISPWLIHHSRVGYEVSLGLFLFSIGVYFFWAGLKRAHYFTLGFVFLSLSTYSAYTQRFIVPMFIVGFLLIFRKSIFSRELKEYLKRGLKIALVLQIPHFFILFKPAFFPKQNLLGLGIISEQAAKISYFLPSLLSQILAFCREFLSQYFTYFSPRSLFFLPDPDLQRSIPDISVFYFWMIIPYIVGFIFLWKRRKSKFAQFLFLLAIITPVPAALTHDPFSTHRALPHFLSLMLIISIGIDKLIDFLPKKIEIFSFSFFIVLSLLFLWRSYFVLLPNERAKVWGYGFKKLAEETRLRLESNFVVDQARIKPAYIQLAFHLKYPPEEFQKKVNKSVKKNYYNETKFDSYYKFANLETRNINWVDDVYKKQILVGDEFTISEHQAKEHFLEKVFEIRSPVDEIIFVGYKTDPERKCKTTPDNINCKNL
jgi:4-amino-4-deoxy-L-arabinose transferase-like glycosyltransferase